MGRKKIWAGSKNENWLGVNNEYENRQRYINGLILPVHQRLLRRKCRCCSLASCSLAPSTSRQESQKSALSSTIRRSKGRRQGSSSISLSIIIEMLLWIFPLLSLINRRTFPHDHRSALIGLKARRGLSLSSSISGALHPFVPQDVVTISSSSSHRLERLKSIR